MTPFVAFLLGVLVGIVIAAIALAVCASDRLWDWIDGDLRDVHRPGGGI